MQVYVPLNTTRSRYEETKPFAQAIAQLLEKQTPDKVVSKMKKRTRKGKVFVDWSQNHSAKRRSPSTRCAPASGPPPRPRSAGSEVERPPRAATADWLVFETGDVLKRVEQHGDLFAPVLELEQKLPELDGLS